MKFNLKLFVLVGVLAGFRDVCGMEEENKDYGDFIVAELTDDVNDELKTAIDKMRVIKAVYRADTGGNVEIISCAFQEKLSHILVCSGDNVQRVEGGAFNVIGKKICYNMQKDVEYTVYFIFNGGSIESTENMFKFCLNLISADFRYFDTKNVTDMFNMFSCCTSLTKLDLSNFNTSNVIDMYSMFNDCSALKELNLSSFNTQNVTDMSRMFSCCTSLTKLDLSNFNTQKVTDMCSMFNDCSALKELNLSNFNTQNVTNMSRMFYNCSDLMELDLSKFNTSNVTNMSNTFDECTSLNPVFLPVEGTEIKKRCIYGGDEYVCWNNREVGGLEPKKVKFKDPNEIVKKISPKKED